MNKLLSIAVLALLGSTTAYKLRYNDADDLDADEDTAETLRSIATAEKAHNTKFAGISKDEEKLLLKEKSSLNFDEEGDFDANHPRFSYVGISEVPSYPEARPIGEVLMQLKDAELVQDNQILSGSNDEDEMASTLDSISQAEK
jgi:hypothetical protein